MLLEFRLHGEDGETIHLDPFAVESMRQRQMGAERVVDVLTHSGERYRLDDAQRDVVRSILDATEEQEIVLGDDHAICDQG